MPPRVDRAQFMADHRYCFAFIQSERTGACGRADVLARRQDSQHAMKRGIDGFGDSSGRQHLGFGPVHVITPVAGENVSRYKRERSCDQPENCGKSAVFTVATGRDHLPRPGIE
jgi:hypothetical protein